MNQIHYTESFASDLKQVTSKRLENQIIHDIELLPSIPILGSSVLPLSIKRIYGDHVRKIPVKPFNIIYEVTEDNDFNILGLVHQRAAH